MFIHPSSGILSYVARNQLNVVCIYVFSVVYSHAVDNEVAHQIIYSGFINELVNVLELTSDHLIVS